MTLTINETKAFIELLKASRVKPLSELIASVKGNEIEKKMLRYTLSYYLIATCSEGKDFPGMSKVLELSKKMVESAIFIAETEID